MAEVDRHTAVSTITDVARAAGVSVATVSRALRGLDRVSPATRERVLRIATDLDYVASPTATSLASGRTQIVGVVAPFLTKWFFATLVSAIEKALRAEHHHVLLFDLEDDTFEHRLRLSQNMLWKRVDGVISLNVPMEPDELSLIDRLGLPMVTIGSHIEGRPCVRIDDALAMRLATEHVIGLGHERIAYVGAVPTNVAHIQTPQARLASFRATMRSHGLTNDKRWIIASGWTADSARDHCLDLLRHEGRPTAIIAASDEMAFGVMAAARHLGLDVPRDLSVIGVDDHQLSGALELTTVRQDVVEQGSRAARHLLDVLLRGEPLTTEVIDIPLELIVRSTTAPPRA